MDLKDIQSHKSEKEKVISNNDCKYIKNFFSIFSLDVPEDLQKAISSFEKEETLENQLKIKTELARFYLESKDPFIKDEFWDECRDNCQSILYFKEFDKQLGESLTKEEITF